MPEESQALVRFIAGWVEDGVSDDGMPRYRDTVQIIKAVPPHTVLPPTEATEADFEQYPGPHQLFQKEQGSRARQPVQDGFPLAMWPVVSPAQFKMLAARDVVTIEQLSKLRPDPAMPGDLRELIDRAKQMLNLSANLGKFEAQLRERDGQIAALTEQVNEMRGTISAQNALIATMKMTAAPVQQPIAQVA